MRACDRSSSERVCPGRGEIDVRGDDILDILTTTEERYGNARTHEADWLIKHEGGVTATAWTRREIHYNTTKLAYPPRSQKQETAKKQSATQADNSAGNNRKSRLNLLAGALCSRVDKGEEETAGG